MKKSKKIIITILSIICIIFIVIIGYKIYEYCTEFRLDNTNKYKVTTDTRFLTMRNDGGSHDDIYYGIDLEKRKVSKYREIFKANLGSRIFRFIHIRKIEFSKDLTENDVNKLEILLSNTSLEEYNEEYTRDKEEQSTEKSNEQRLNPGTYTSSYWYTVENMNYGEIDVYGESFKEAFLDIVEN